MNVAAVTQSIGAWFAAKYRWVKKTFHIKRSANGWGAPAIDEGHQYYRTQYERLITVLPGLPRGVSHPDAHERKNTILAFASILDGLHNYGDDPILPPGVRRVVIRENQTRLAAFGEVEQLSFWGRFMASLAPVLPYLLIGGLALSVTGWGTSLWNGWRAERLETRLEQANETSEANYRAAERWKLAAEEYREGLVDAAQVARHAADALEAERAAQARAAARERRRNREIQDVLSGSPEPPAWRLRDPEPTEGSDPAAPSP